LLNAIFGVPDVTATLDEAHALGENLMDDSTADSTKIGDWIFAILLACAVVYLFAKSDKHDNQPQWEAEVAQELAWR
jgi:hypothetical protein